MYHFDVNEPVKEPPGVNNHKSASSLFKSVKRQITRNRTSYSCVTCRRRKVKCDKTRPICGGCQRANERCLYGDDGPVNEVQPAASKEDDGPMWKKRKSSLNGGDVTAMPVANAAGTDDLTPPSDLKAIEDQLQRLTKMVDLLRSGQSSNNDLRLKELLTPEPSSDSGSDGVQPRPSMSLDMFQSKNPAPTTESTDISTPLSSLKLSNGEVRAEDPFWHHISDELDQLNLLMRRRDNTFAGALSPQNQQCDVPRDRPSHVQVEHELETDDLWRPNDFHKEAGANTLDSLDLGSDDPIIGLMAFSKSSLLQGVPLKSSPTAALYHMTQGLPTRTQSNVLFRSWLSGVYPVIGIFMPSEIFGKHEDFWDTLANAGSSSEPKQPDLDVLTVLNAIWYAGSLSISAKGLRQWFPQTTRAQLSTYYHDQIVFCLLLGSFRRDISLYKLGALVLLQSMPIAEEDPVQNSLYIALIVRLALTLGLHREPTLFELSVTEEGMRRRLWWQIIQLDIFNVVASGYPSQVSERFCDTRVVCEDRDAYMSGDTTVSASTHGSLQDPSPQSATTQGEALNPLAFRTLAIYARGKSILACALRSVVSIHLETKRLRNEDVNEMKRIMTEAEGHIHGIIKSIPSKGLPEMGFNPGISRDAYSRPSDSDVLMAAPITSNDIAYYSTSPNETDPSWSLASFHRQRQAAYNKWARISLSMLMDKIHCVVYAPFLKNTKSKLWGVGRQCALHNCHSFLRKFISLATDPDLEPFRWGWPASYGPLHAVLIVLVDVYERPSSVEAPRSRELVDKVFALSALEAGIVGGPYGVTVQRPLREGGVGAWDMLRGLRSAAWQKAGLDPRVLWTEDDQLAVGLATPLTDTQMIAQSLREDSIHDNQTVRDGNPCTEGTKSTAQGVEYMLQLNRAAFSNDGSGPAETFSGNHTSRSQFPPGIGRDARLGAGRTLAHREGQSKMPFPLTQHMDRCSGKAAEVNAPPDRILNIHDHMPRPEGGTRTCGGNLTEFVTEREPNMGPRPFEETSHASGQAGWQQSASNSDIDAHNVTQNQTPVQQAYRATDGRGYTNGFGNQLLNSHGGQPHGDQSSTENGLHQGDTEMELGFDWEKWDSVFGQYSGFTDFMDDETAWEHVNA